MNRIIIAGAFALSFIATPLLAENNASVGYGTSAESALGFLTLNKNPRPFTRDAQLGQGIYSDDIPLRTTAQSQRHQVFRQGDVSSSRTLNGRRGFERIDR